MTTRMFLNLQVNILCYLVHIETSLTQLLHGLMPRVSVNVCNEVLQEPLNKVWGCHHEYRCRKLRLYHFASSHHTCSGPSCLWPLAADKNLLSAQGPTTGVDLQSPNLAPKLDTLYMIPCMGAFWRTLSVHSWSQVFAAGGPSPPKKTRERAVGHTTGIKDGRPATSIVGVFGWWVSLGPEGLGLGDPTLMNQLSTGGWTVHCFDTFPPSDSTFWWRQNGKRPPASHSLIISVLLASGNVAFGILCF